MYKITFIIQRQVAIGYGIYLVTLVISAGKKSMVTLVMQYNSWKLLVIFGLGKALGVVRWRINSLYASLALHSLGNLISITIAMLFIQGKFY